MPAIPDAAWLPSVARRRVPLAGRDVEIALLDWGGSGPLALFHHGTGFCAGIWELVAAPLRERFRVVAVDARGHGDSSRPEGPDAYHWDHFAEDLLAVARLLAAEGNGGVALGVGHSFGGTAMLGAAARNPKLFDRLLLVDPVIPPPPSLGDPPQRRRRVSGLAQAARRRRARFPSREEARTRWARHPLFASWDPRALDLYAVQGLRDSGDGQVELKCPGAVEAAIFDSGIDFDAIALAERVSAPTRILWARQGDFPRPVYERLAASMGEARIEDLPTGHLAPMERPDLIVDAIERFVAADSGGRAAQRSTG